MRTAGFFANGGAAFLASEADNAAKGKATNKAADSNVERTKGEKIIGRRTAQA